MSHNNMWDNTELSKIHGIIITEREEKDIKAGKIFKETTFKYFPNKMENIDYDLRSLAAENLNL